MCCPLCYPHYTYFNGICNYGGETEERCGVECGGVLLPVCKWHFSVWRMVGLEQSYGVGMVCTIGNEG